MKVGAYYFDGWTGRTNHVRQRLTDDFGEREPVWGWVTSTPRAMREQIDCAADAGIGFFSFCWYNYQSETEQAREMAVHLNHGLELFLSAPNRARMEFCLLVANHGGMRILPSDWADCCARWVPLLGRPEALKVAGKPLLIFFSPGELHKAFGEPAQVREAFDALRAQAQDAGLAGVTIAGCTGVAQDYAWLVESGYDCLTGYNYWPLGAQGPGKDHRFEDLVAAHRPTWDNLATAPLPYIPLATTGWDRRPWEAYDATGDEAERPRYPDRTPEGLEALTRQGVAWLRAHADRTPEEQMLLLYAWNENGEGAYLTPTKEEGDVWLQAVKRGLI